MIDKYVSLFSKLRTDKSKTRWTEATRHRAPYKPLLLLSVIDLFAQGSIKSNMVELTPDLIETFNLYWSRVMPPDKRSTIALPFFHLKSDGFWELLPRPHKEIVLNSGIQLRSISKIHDNVLGVRLDDELFEHLQVEDSRNLLRTVLIETYFSLELRPRLVEQGVINVDAYHYSQKLLDRAKEKTLKETQDKDEQYQPAIRDQGFRRAVITTYAHRCAFCGIRMLTPDGHTAVAAAHIIPWRISHNDDPRNGMALCHLCHWTFDKGLLGLSEKYLVLTSHHLKAQKNLPGHLLTLESRLIHGPAEKILWPDLEAIAWHEVNIFRR